VAEDVFEENAKRSDCLNDVPDVRPEVPGIIFSCSLSGRGKWLAGISPSDNANSVSKAFHWEGFKIRPNRCGSQLSRFHLRNQVGNGEGFDLHMSDDSMSKPSKLKSSLDTPISCAKTEYSG